MRPLASTLLRFAALPVLAGLGAGAWAGDCVGQRGGELVVTASDRCLGQMRRDTALRRQVVQAIDVGVAALPAAQVTAQPAARSGASRANLAHPLARLSQLNAQSRYLWSLSNPAPSYYGQTQTVAR